MPDGPQSCQFIPVSGPSLFLKIITCLFLTVSGPGGGARAQLPSSTWGLRSQPGMEPVSLAREGGLNHWTTRDRPAFPPEFLPQHIAPCGRAPVSGSARPTQPRRGSLGSGAFSLAEGCFRREGVGRSSCGDRGLSLWLASLRGARCARSPSGGAVCARPEGGHGVCIQPEGGRGVRIQPKAGRGVCAARGGQGVRAGGTGKENWIAPPPGAQPPPCIDRNQPVTLLL